MSKAYQEGYAAIVWNTEPFGTPVQPERKRGKSVHLIRDELDQPVQSMASGKFYTSKAKLRAEYRELGYTEVGNDPQRNAGYRRPKVDRQAVHEDLQRARARFERGERYGGPPRHSR